MKAAKWNSAIKMLFTYLHNQLVVVPLEWWLWSIISQWFCGTKGIFSLQRKALAVCSWALEYRAFLEKKREKCYMWVLSMCLTLLIVFFFTRSPKQRMLALMPCMDGELDGDVPAVTASAISRRASRMWLHDMICRTQKFCENHCLFQEKVQWWPTCWEVFILKRLKRPHRALKKDAGHSAFSPGSRMLPQALSTIE